MRFLFLTQYFPPEVGAPQVRLAAMARELVRLGHEVEVVTALPNYPQGSIWPEFRGQFYRRDEWEGIAVHRVWVFAATGAGWRRILNYLSFAITSLIGLARAQRPDWLFVESPPLTTSVPAFLFARWWARPFILNVADLWPDSMRELGLMRAGLALRTAEWLERWAYRAARYVNAVTEGIQRTLIERKALPLGKVLFLPNGVDTKLFRPRPPDSALAASLDLTDRRVILYAGTLGLFQGLDVAIDAFEQLQSSDPDAVLVFLGSGSDRSRLMEKVRSRGQTNVRFIDPQPLEFVARLYSVAYAGFASLKDLPLFDGARPSKVFPVMSSGKPVVYSGAGEGARLILHANAGIVTAPEDSSELLDAIRGLLRNPAQASSLGLNGRRYVEAHLSWPYVVGRWIEQFSSQTTTIDHELPISFAGGSQ